LVVGGLPGGNGHPQTDLRNPKKTSEDLERVKEGKKGANKSREKGTKIPDGCEPENKEERQKKEKKEKALRKEKVWGLSIIKDRMETRGCTSRSVPALKRGRKKKSKKERDDNRLRRVKKKRKF